MRPARREFTARPASGKIATAWISHDSLGAFAQENTDAHRLASAREGWVERYGDNVLLSFQNDRTREILLRELENWSCAAERNWSRVFARFLPKQNAERVAPQLLSGDATVPLTTTVQERGVKYAIDFGAGYSAGLFLDQRENRRFVRQTKPRRSLNCFAYTCSFSVVAALGGGETLSIDLSRKSLDRGRENFSLNGLTNEGHRFLADDVLDVLPRLTRKGEKFDCIILDPPTFSRSHRGNAWQIERDFERLVRAALELAASRAKILLSTNCARLTMRDLEALARFSLKAARRAGEIILGSRLPDFPGNSGARSLWLELRD